MVELKETPIQKETVYHGKFLEFHCDRVKLPNGHTATREYLHHPGAVAILPVLEDGRIMLVKQFRYPIETVLLEIPAGKIDPGEDRENCARRELTEEIGYEPEELLYLTSIWTTPGFTDEIIHLYLARKLRPLKREPDEDEFLETVIMTREEISAYLDTNPVIDAKTALALSFVERRNLW